MRPGLKSYLTYLMPNNTPIHTTRQTSVIPKSTHNALPPDQALLKLLPVTSGSEVSVTVVVDPSSMTTSHKSM